MVLPGPFLLFWFLPERLSRRPVTPPLNSSISSANLIAPACGDPAPALWTDHMSSGNSDMDAAVSAVWSFLACSSNI